MDHYHLLYENDEWQLKKEHALSPSWSFGTSDKTEAIRKSAEYLVFSGSFLTVYNADGSISEERTFPRGADMRRIRELIMRNK